MPIDRAAVLRNAEKLVRQGKVDLAIAEYRRVVDDDPRDWSSANLLGDLYIRAGQVDQGVGQFVRIAEHLCEAGFLSRASALYRKVLKVTPDDERAMLRAAEMAAEQGLVADARGWLSALGDRRRRRGDVRGFAEIQIRLGALDPEDYDARLVAAGARAELNDHAGALADFKALAAELSGKGRAEAALTALREAVHLAPDDEEIRDRLVEAHLAAGDVSSALPTLSAGWAKGDPRLLLRIAEAQATSGRGDEALAIVRDLLAADPGRRDAVAGLGWMLAERWPHLGFQMVDRAAAVAVGEEDWGSAAAALQEFVTRVPAHVPALLRLVEVCVDGGLEATLHSAQGQLADAYLAAGLPTEARFIAEDLVAREPWERANIERFRKALELSGEADPDQVIADRLNGTSPFISLDLSRPGEEFPGPRADLDINVGAGPDAPGGTEDASSVDGHLEAAWRDEASRQASLDAADEDFSRGVALHQTGRDDEALALLTSASRAPRLRFAGASLAGRIYRDRGDLPQAIDWFERAAQAPAATDEEGYALLHELADALERTGEVARALAICIELQAEAGRYRDVGERIDRLFKAQRRE